MCDLELLMAKIKLNLILEFMKKYEYTKKEFCTLCLISEKTLDKLIAGDNDVNKEVFSKIANILGCSVIDLLADELQSFCVYRNLVIKGDQ